MVLSQARIEHVRSMRLAAQLCMVALCCDVAGRQLVAEMMARTRSSSGPASAKADAESGTEVRCWAEARVPGSEAEEG